MLFDSLITTRVVFEVREQLAGARVGRVFAPAEDSAVLEFNRRGPGAQLLLSWRAQQARVHLAEDLVPAPSLASAFLDVLRRYLRGAQLLSVEQLGFDRVIRLGFINAENLGPEATCALVVEPIGRWANAVLCDAAGLIRESAHHVPGAVNRYRQLVPGERYYPPPGQDQPRLDRLSPGDLDVLATAAPEVPLKTLLREGCQGASPALLTELWARTGLDPDAGARAQAPGWGEALTSAMAGIVAEAQAGEAWIYRPRPGRPFAYPVALRSRAEDLREPAPTLSEALARVASEVTREDRLREQRERLGGAVGRARQQIMRRRESRERALAEAAEGGRWREFGEALLSNLWRLEWGGPEVELPLYDESGERLVRIPVNPAYSPQDNARIYFQRYKKSQRAAQRLPELVEADRRLEDYLEEMTDEIERGGEEELGELEEELLRLGYLKRRKRRATPPARSFHRVSSPDGWTVWYGKTGLQNNRLLREAQAEDLWLHVRDGSGGHVLIRTGGRPEEVPETTLEWAACLAAGLSRLRGSSHVEVAYTQYRHVRKPRGTPPGFVLYDHYSTLAVAPLWPPPDTSTETGGAPD